MIAVMHDLNLTAMFADVNGDDEEGCIVIPGAPAGVLTNEIMEEVFGCRMHVGGLPEAGTPFILPQTVVN